MQKLTAHDVLRRYNDERMPEFADIELTGVNQTGRFGNTPLDIAATRGNIEEVRALLEGGADPNARCEHGVTALHDAVGLGHLEIAKLLLSNGAKPDARAEFGGTPREWAERKGFTDIVALLDGTVSGNS